MKDVSRRMVRLHLLATHPVYGGGYPSSCLDGAALATSAYDLIVPSRNYIEDLDLAPLRRDPTLIRHLPSTGGIERVLRQDYVQLAPSHLLDCRHPGLDLLALVADKAALYILV